MKNLEPHITLCNGMTVPQLFDFAAETIDRFTGNKENFKRDLREIHARYNNAIGWGPRKLERWAHRELTKLICNPAMEEKVYK